MNCLKRQCHMKFFKGYFLNFTWSIIGYFDPYYMYIIYKQYIEDKALSLIEGEVAQIFNNYNLKISIFLVCKTFNLRKNVSCCSWRKDLTRSSTAFKFSCFLIYKIIDLQENCKTSFGQWIMFAFVVTYLTYLTASSWDWETLK